MDGHTKVEPRSKPLFAKLSPATEDTTRADDSSIACDLWSFYLFEVRFLTRVGILDIITDWNFRCVTPRHRLRNSVSVGGVCSQCQVWTSGSIVTVVAQNHNL